jgi:PAS domain S-box-containing protein
LSDEEKVKEQLVEELTLYRTLLDSLPDLIYAKDTEGRFILVNAAQARYMGRTTPDELLGKSDFDFYPPELAEQYHADELAILESGQPLIDHEEINIDHQLGGQTWTLTTKIPFRDNQGRLAGIMGISRDITELKQVEAERERLVSVLERRSTQLQTVAEVSRIASGILAPRELFQQIVDLVCERFDLYYVGLFLVVESDELADSLGEWAYLEAGTGQAGQILRKQRHRLQVGGNSMVGQSIATGEARVALDVGKEAQRFPNPELPDTRSELALPLISRGKTIGALTVQSSQSAAFGQEDILIFQTLAGQLANAIENARLLEQTQQALDELTAIQRRYVRDAWSRYLDKDR